MTDSDLLLGRAFDLPDMVAKPDVRAKAIRERLGRLGPDLSDASRQARADQPRAVAWVVEKTHEAIRSGILEEYFADVRNVDRAVELLDPMNAPDVIDIEITMRIAATCLEKVKAFVLAHPFGVGPESR